MNPHPYHELVDACRRRDVEKFMSKKKKYKFKEETLNEALRETHVDDVDSIVYLLENGAKDVQYVVDRALQANQLDRLDEIVDYCQYDPKFRYIDLVRSGWNPEEISEVYRDALHREEELGKLFPVPPREDDVFYLDLIHEALDYFIETDYTGYDGKATYYVAMLTDDGDYWIRMLYHYADSPNYLQLMYTKIRARNDIELDGEDLLTQLSELRIYRDHTTFILRVLDDYPSASPQLHWKLTYKIINTTYIDGTVSDRLWIMLIRYPNEGTYEEWKQIMNKVINRWPSKIQEICNQFLHVFIRSSPAEQNIDRDIADMMVRFTDGWDEDTTPPIMMAMLALRKRMYGVLKRPTPAWDPALLNSLFRNGLPHNQSARIFWLRQGVTNLLGIRYIPLGEILPLYRAVKGYAIRRKMREENYNLDTCLREQEGTAIIHASAGNESRRLPFELIDEIIDEY